MELLPVELRKTLPPLYSQKSCPTPIVHVKLFTPDSSFTWYVTEGAEQEDGDWLIFGLVIGFEEEWGYSLLSEIASARGPLGLPVERDLWFKPGRLIKCFVANVHPPRRGKEKCEMSEKVQFQTNVPIDVALKYNDGKEVTGQYGDQVLYTLTDGRVMYVPPIVKKKIDELGIGRGELFTITKAENNGAGAPSSG